MACFERAADWTGSIDIRMGSAAWVMASFRDAASLCSAIADASLVSDPGPNGCLTTKAAVGS